MSSLRILVVDDDSDFAEGLAEYLELSGHQVVVAASGEEAIELFRDTRFDTALVDIRLPHRTGVETCQAMREIDPDARVMLMTGYIAQQFETWTKRSGALQVLQKPFDPKLVLREIESAREIC